MSVSTQAQAIDRRRDIKSRLAIASVCRWLPTPTDASAGTFILNRLSAMAQLADVSIVQPIPFFPALRPAPAWSQSPSRVQGSVEVQHAPMFYVPGVLKSLDGRWLGRSIRGLLSGMRKRGKLDVIDAHFGYPEGVGCSRVAREMGVPHFITIRGLETDVLKRPGVREQLLEAFHSATGIISVSHSLRDLVVTHGIDPGKVLVAPNAVDRTTFRPGDRHQARGKVGVSHEELLIVCVGHLLAVKRHTVLIDAVAELRKTLPVKLVIIGGAGHEPQYPTLLKEQVKRLGIEESVRFAGKLPPAQVADWLRAANVFALASAREGCCNAVLEALASGAPVIATSVGDNPHFVREGVDGHLVAPDDAAALARALRQGLSRTWDARDIASRLSVGAWVDTAAQVIDFMQARVTPEATRSAA